MSSEIAHQLLRELQELGVEVVCDRDGLGYRPKSAVTPELRARIVSCKSELVALLEASEGARARATCGPIGRRDSDSPAPCFCCGSLEFWALAHLLHWVCARCHAPDRATDDLRWLRLSSPRRSACGGGAQ